MKRNGLYQFLLSLLSIFILFSGCSPGWVQPSGSMESDTTRLSGNATRAIQIKGSDTIVNLVEAWAEGFAKLRPEVNLSITGGGSGTGFAALLNNTCDICMSSRSIEDKELETARKSNIKPVEFMVGLDGLIVIVHPSNPVSQIALSQVRDIFIGAVQNWKEVGGLDSTIVILSRESNSGTHLFFKEHVLRKGMKKGKEEFSPHALLMPSSQAIVNEVVQNPHAVGYVGMGYLSADLKALAISSFSSTVFVMPVIENVMNDSYPISRPLFLYTNGEPADAVSDFIDFALSEEGQVIVRQVDFVPVLKI